MLFSFRFWNQSPHDIAEYRLFYSHRFVKHASFSPNVRKVDKKNYCLFFFLFFKGEMHYFFLSCKVFFFSFVSECIAFF